jgi:hypothetical protein
MVNQMRVGLYSICVSLFLGVVSEAHAGPTLLEEVRNGNRAALESIHTFYCQVVVTYEPKPQIPVPAGEYWRSLDAVRVRWHQGEKRFDSILRDSKVWNLAVAPGANEHSAPGGALVRYDGSPLGPCDAWALGLLTLPAQEKIAYACFDDLLNQAHDLQQVESRVENGTEFIIVKITHARAQEEIWFEHGSNYLARKLFITWPNKQRSESQVVRFAEVAPAIFFPKQVETRSYSADGKFLHRREVAFSGFKVNQPFPEETFKVHFPRGAQLDDLIAGKRYTVDENGNPISPSSDLPKVAPLSAGAAPRTETRVEPQSWTRWILWLSLGILGTGGGLWLVRRWRQSRIN